MVFVFRALRTPPRQLPPSIENRALLKLPFADLRKRVISPPPRSARSGLPSLSILWIAINFPASDIRCQGFHCLYLFYRNAEEIIRKHYEISQLPGLD